VGGYADDFAGNPVRIDGVVEFLGRMMQFETVAVVRFGEDNRIILTPALHQVTDTSIFPALGIDFGEVDIVSIKSRVHFWRGYVETGIAGAVVVIDAPGLGPADLSTVEYKNIPGDIYPLSGRR
jgi:microcystin degradation protein MlrC